MKTHIDGRIATGETTELEPKAVDVIRKVLAEAQGSLMKQNLLAHLPLRIETDKIEIEQHTASDIWTISVHLDFSENLPDKLPDPVAKVYAGDPLDTGQQDEEFLNFIAGETVNSFALGRRTGHDLEELNKALKEAGYQAHIDKSTLTIYVADSVLMTPNTEAENPTSPVLEVVTITRAAVEKC